MQVIEVSVPGTRAQITMQGPAFPPIPSAPIMFSGVPEVPACMQKAAIPTINDSSAVAQQGHALS